MTDSPESAPNAGPASERAAADSTSSASAARSGAVDEPVFAATGVWHFYRSVIRNYWRRFALMLGLTTAYTGVTIARLGAFGVLLAALRYKFGNSDAPPETIVHLSNGLEWIGQSVDFTQLRAAANNDFLYTFLGAMIVAFMIAALFSAFAFFFKDYFAQSITFRASADIRRAMFNHLTRQSVAYFNRQRSGDVISRLTNDVGTVQLSFRFFFQNVVQEPIRIVSLLCVACIASPMLFGLTLPLYAVIMWPMFRAGKKVIKHGRGRQVKLGLVTEAIQQLFGGIRIVKAFGMEAHERSRFVQKNAELVKSSLRMVKAKAKGRSLQELLYNVGVAGFLFAAVWLLAEGVMELEVLLVFILAIVDTYHPIKALSKAYNTMMEARAGVERVIEVLGERPLIADDATLEEFPGLREEIRFEGVDFSYDHVEAELAKEILNAEPSSTEEPAPVEPLVDEERPFPGVIQGVSLDVKAGEVVALVGPSGAGKSTLVDLLARFYDPQAGRILVDGVDIRRYRQSSYVRAIAVVSQDPFLFNDSIRENVRYGKSDATDAEVEDAARVACAHEFILEQPEGYETVIGDRGVKLSGGQRQRITIARAVLKNAPILILDEATSSLDTRSEREVQEAMENLMRDRTTFVIAHRLSTIVGADKIVVLDDGRIVELGNHDELLGRKGVYSRLWLSQNAGGSEDPRSVSPPVGSA